MDAKEVINDWENCLNTADLKGIVDLYINGAVLWGTFSQGICDSSELIQEYFQDLFVKQELKVNFSSIKSRTYSDTTLFSGTYEFSYLEGEQVTHPARFTFVVCKDKQGNYKIAEHHSSLIP